MKPPPDLLYKCPLCGRENFTWRGLRAHICQAKPAGKLSSRGAPLTADEFQQAVNAAIIQNR